MRQSFPLVIKDYKFNRVSLLIDGVNGQLSDIDFYDGVRKVLQSTHTISFDITASSYFRKNPFLQNAISAMSGLSASYLEALKTLLESLELDYSSKGSLTSLLEVMKNALFGRLQ